VQPSGDRHPVNAPTAGSLGPAQNALRCPVCRSIEWFRNCNTLVESESTGEIAFRCVLPSDPRLVSSPWACMICAYEVPEPSVLFERLNAMAVAA
jgi:hypothetical protein